MASQLVLAILAASLLRISSAQPIFVSPPRSIGNDQIPTCFYVLTNNFQRMPSFYHLPRDPVMAYVVLQPPVARWVQVCRTPDRFSGQANGHADDVGQVYPISEGWSMGLQQAGLAGARVPFWDSILLRNQVNYLHNYNLKGNLFPWQPLTSTNLNYFSIFIQSPSSEAASGTPVAGSNATEPNESGSPEAVPNGTEPIESGTPEGGPNVTAPNESCADPKTSPLDMTQMNETVKTRVIGELLGDTIPDMRELSFCSWIYTDDKMDDYYFIYHKSTIVPTNIFSTVFDIRKDFAILVDVHPTYVDFWIGGKYVTVEGLYTKAGDWQHWCFTWSGIDKGNVKVFVDGKPFKELTGLNTDYTLPGNESVTLLQVQSTPVDSQEPIKGFSLKTVDFNLWNRTVTQEEVTQLFQCSAEIGGNVLNWNETKENLNITPDRYRRRKNPFSPFDLPGGFDNQEQKQVKATLKQDLPEMKELTYCLYVSMRNESIRSYWFSLKDDKGNVLSAFNHPMPRIGMATVADVDLIDMYYMWPTNVFACVAWSGVSGILQLFLDGTLTQNATNVALGMTIPANARIELQQEQFKAMDHASNSDGSYYQVLEFSMWDRVLTQEEVFNVTWYSTEGTKPIVSWNEAQFDIYVSRLCQQPPEMSLYDRYAQPGGSRVGMKTKTATTFTEFTITFWYYCDKSDLDGLKVLYFPPNLHLEFSLDKVVLTLRDVTNEIATPLVQKNWTHFSLTWSGQTGGALEYFVNRQSVGKVADFAPGDVVLQKYAISQGGGPVQATLEHFRQPFWFKMTDVNMWDRILSPAELAEISKCTGTMSGNILNAFTFEWKAKKI